LIKHYAQDLDFKYITASSKEEFDSVYAEFLANNVGGTSVVFEVFTDSEEESWALEMVRNIKKDYKSAAKDAARSFLGDTSVMALKKVLGKR